MLFHLPKNLRMRNKRQRNTWGFLICSDLSVPLTFFHEILKKFYGASHITSIVY